MYVTSNFQKAFHMKKKTEAKNISDAEVNRVEVIMKQMLEYLLCAQRLCGILYCLKRHQIIIISANLSDWGNRERSQSLVSIELEEISDISVCLQNSWGLLRHESN